MDTYRNGIRVEPDEGYNGWTNYPTWAVKLWIDNDQGEYEYWRDAAREAIDLVETRHARSVNAVGHLSQVLREEHEGNAEDYNESGSAAVFGDLIGYALGCVNWYEIAEALIQEVNE